MSANPLIIFREREAVFAPQYFGTVAYYAAAAAYGKVYIDAEMTADKRFKSTHRCTIVDTRDEITLTVPVTHPHGRHSWNDTLVSTHGQWWNKHLTALESAYGRTPFFEFYIDRFREIFNGDNCKSGAMTVASLDCQCDRIVRSILGLGNDVVYTAADSPAPEQCIDMRHFSGCLAEAPAYYQIRADRLGFRANLTILDLIFNMGPEAPYIIKEYQRTSKF